MNAKEKNLELVALKESLTAGAISTAEYISGITKILNAPEDEKFSANKNLGLKVDNEKNLIEVGGLKIPFDEDSKSRLLRVATYVKDNPEVVQGQKKFYCGE